MQSIVPFLWFDGRAEEAMNFYVSIFKNSRIVGVTRYGNDGPGPKGAVMTATFLLDGQEFIALNGGPQFTFSPAVSFFVKCETQEEDAPDGQDRHPRSEAGLRAALALTSLHSTSRSVRPDTTRRSEVCLV